MKNINFSYFKFILIAFICSALGVAFVSKKNAESAKPHFALLTDFGYDFAVASIKGVILSRLPDATVTDLDHSLPKFNVTTAGWVLAKSYQYFPKGTIFLCIVDPGVGTKREPLCIKTPHYTFVGPNNGIFDYVLAAEKVRTVYKIDDSYLESGLSTFHGRDLFALAAVDSYNNKLDRLSLFDEAGLCHLKREENHTLAVYIDSYGNIKTDKPVDASLLKQKALDFTLKGRRYVLPFVRTFDEVPQGKLLCYQGSNRTIEIAVNQGSAAQKLGIKALDTLIFDA